MYESSGDTYFDKPLGGEGGSGGQILLYQILLYQILLYQILLYQFAILKLRVLIRQYI